MFLEVLILVVLLGGDHGSVPVPLGAFSQAGGDGVNILFAGSPLQQCQSSFVFGTLWLTKVRIHRRLKFLKFLRGKQRLEFR
jgi:hypothetical protein